MEIRQLRYFIAVAESGNFTRAALRLHVSQPPLSMQIKALEAELGVQLLDRTNRGASLTAAGAAFLEEVRAALDRLDVARRRALLAGRGDSGTVSVGFVSLADFSFLPAALRNFRASHPLVEVQLHELTTDAQIREIRAGRLDLGIGIGPVEAADLLFKPVMSEALMLAAPSGHAAAKEKGAVDLRALATESFIIPPRDIAPGLYDLIISRCRAAGFAPRITQHARQMQTVISLVSSGMGCALVPSSVRHLKRAGVQYRRLRGRFAGVEMGLLSMRSQHNALRERFSSVLEKAAGASARSG